MSNRPKFSFFSLFFLLVMGVATWIIGAKPSHNWDMFPYMAIAMSDSSVPFDTIHARVYREAERTLPSGDFIAISNRQPRLLENATEFQGILKYFENKPLYNAITWLLCQAGVNPVAATHLPSALAFFLLSLLLYGWLRTILSDGWAFLASLALMALPFMIDSARLSSPDMICTLFLVTGLYLSSEVDPFAGLIVSGLATLVRPDAAIQTVMITIAFAGASELSIRTAIIMIGISLALSLFLTGKMVVEFLFTTADYSSRWTFGETVAHYLASLTSGFRGIQTVAVFTVVGLLAIYIRSRLKQDWRTDRWCLLLAGSILSFLVRYLLHPVIEDRFMVFGFVTIFIGSLFTMTLYLENRNMRVRPQ